jgi:DNA-binding NarL/FixJ family response regulator
MKDPIRVVLVDDHALFRQGLRDLLGHYPEFEVIAEGANGREAVTLARRLKPDVILLDIEMPGQDALQTVTELCAQTPATSIVMLTMHEDPAQVHELLSRGASAYLTKTIGREELTATVRSVGNSRGMVLLSVRRETFALIDQINAGRALLSPRQTEVLRLVAEANSNARVADLLFISEATVKRHLTNIYAKLGAVSRVDAIRKATAAKLL